MAEGTEEAAPEGGERGGEGRAEEKERTMAVGRRAGGWQEGEGVEKPEGPTGVSGG